MGPHCRIGIQLPDNTIKSIYCNNNGYFNEVGRILLRNYDKFTLDSLIDSGNIESLGKNKEETYFYVKDGGEHVDDNTAVIDKNMNDFFYKANEEYGYLLTIYGEWLARYDNNGGNIVKLSELFN
jgi:hypothetical protein